ncbi:hypothetical protein KIW84_021923 [Lathyrus oleraceus]|uniref:Uncharacterized protein n=1 Tax=Pisum sativum TaxID=3888 RepID=A0A9D4Y9H7_PEA|nr:hypothetical protein KIW84_021923 [Pisum sativum]
MTTILVLAMPDCGKEFVLETDASGKGGAVLMQEGKPIAYMSQTLSYKAQSKSVYEREFMDNVIAIQKWRPDLLGGISRGRLYHEGRIVILKDLPRVAWILHEFHDPSVGGHLGYLRIYKKIARVAYYERMRKRIQEHVQACEVYQRNEYQTLSLGGLLQPLPVPTQIWIDISMDFLG